MTQLSANTVVYDQIYAKLSTFIDQYTKNEFVDNKQFIEEYQNIITFLNNNISRTINSV
jgi:hypothetical protein